MQINKKSFVIYLDYEEHISLLDDEECGKLFKALFSHAKGETVENLSGASKMAFSFISSQMDRDNEKYLAVIEKRREAGKKGGRPNSGNSSKRPKKSKQAVCEGEDVPTTSPKIDVPTIEDCGAGKEAFSEKQEKAKKANVFFEKQTKAKKADNVTDTDNVTVNDINIKAAACEGEDVPTTSPKIDVPTIEDCGAGKELFDQIANLYFKLTGRMCSANDYTAITQVIECTQDFELIKNVMTDLHNRYKPKYAGDKIKTFKYFVGAVFEAAAKPESAADKRLVDDERLNKALNDYLKYREKNKNPVYDIKLFLEELNRLAPNDTDTQILILNRGIVGGWKNIYPVQEQKKEANTSKKSRFNNFEQRNINPEKLREFERIALQKELERLKR